MDAQHNAFIYGIQGECRVNTASRYSAKITRDRLAILGPGDEVFISAGAGGSRFLLISGKPLNEAVARGGPFVMNTEHELRQAFADYRAGNF